MIYWLARAAKSRTRPILWVGLNSLNFQPYHDYSSESIPHSFNEYQTYSKIKRFRYPKLSRHSRNFFPYSR